MLLAVPNVSEGRDAATLQAIRAALGPGLVHDSADPDHHRAVFTVAGEPGALHGPVLRAARVARERIDLGGHDGVHPRVGALDVAPIVYLEDADRGAAAAEALVLADALGADGFPVYLYGALAGGRTRASLRRPGALDTLRPDFGPPPAEVARISRSGPAYPETEGRGRGAGAVLVAARPPLLAFNVVLAPPATLELAKQVAAAIRETGTHGLPGVRALGLRLRSTGAIQVSTNVEDITRVSAMDVVRAVAAHAPVAATELVAPAPARAIGGLGESHPHEGPAPLEDHLP